MISPHLSHSSYPQNQGRILLKEFRRLPSGAFLSTLLELNKLSAAKAASYRITTGTLPRVALRRNPVTIGRILIGMFAHLLEREFLPGVLLHRSEGGVIHQEGVKE